MMLGWGMGHSLFYNTLTLNENELLVKESKIQNLLLRIGTNLGGGRDLVIEFGPYTFQCVLTVLDKFLF